MYPFAGERERTKKKNLQIISLSLLIRQSSTDGDLALNAQHTQSWLHNHFLDRSEVTWCVEDEQRLRRHISRLKGERTMVRSTAVELESVHAEPLNSKNTISLAEARKLDLETAVLMQVDIL